MNLNHGRLLNGHTNEPCTIRTRPSVSLSEPEQLRDQNNHLSMYLFEMFDHTADIRCKVLGLVELRVISTGAPPRQRVVEFVQV